MFLEEFIKTLRVQKDIDEVVLAYLRYLHSYLGGSTYYYQFVRQELRFILAQKFSDFSHAIGHELEDPDLMLTWKDKTASGSFPWVSWDLKAMVQAGDLKYPDDLLEVEKNPQFMNMVRQQLGSPSFCRTHVSGGEVIGIILGFGRGFISPQSRDEINLAQSYFEIAYQKNSLVRDLHRLEINDPITGLLNMRSFLEVLELEIARSRRIRLPLSLLSIRWDQYAQTQAMHGRSLTGLFLHRLGQFFKSSKRVNDIVASPQPGDFAFLLPHTNSSGAIVKAERLRKEVEHLSKDKDITVSIGLSEYPSFCHDAEELRESADKSLFQVLKEGGNHICVATPPINFVQDFVPRTELYIPPHKKEYTRR